MIKDVFVLSKKAYHCRMMKYIWNLNYFDFSHMCPYFWLTICNHFIFPIVFIIKESVKAVAKFVEFLADWAATLESKKIQAYIEKIAGNDESFIEELSYNAKLRKKIQHIIEKYDVRVNYDYSVLSMVDKALDKAESIHYVKKKAEENKNDEIERKKKEAEREKAKQQKLKEIEFYNSELYRLQKEKEEKQRIARKKLIVKLNSIIKPVFTICAYILGAILVSAVFYGLFKVVHYFAYDIKPSTVKELKKFLWYIAIVLLSISGIALTVFLLYKLFSNMTIRISAPFEKIKLPYFIENIFNKILSFFRYVGSKFAYVFIQIGKGASLTLQMFKNQCPAIKWKD